MPPYQVTIPVTFTVKEPSPEQAISSVSAYLEALADTAFTKRTSSAPSISTSTKHPLN
jgi:hypothetical protein